MRSDVVKNAMKMGKFMLDVMTSYNNYSKRVVSLEPFTGGIMSTVSSLISMGLIWMFWWDWYGCFEGGKDYNILYHVKYLK